MEGIYYNSWQSSCKAQFGALKEGESTCFTIEVPLANVEQVELVIRKEDGRHGSEYYQMKRGADREHNFTYELREGTGLYFYYFQIKQNKYGGMHHLYYGSKDGGGGEGQVYVDESSVLSYQLTCYSKTEVAPSWYRKGIAYQIFPDRFYNGNTNGEVTHPKPNSFIYGTTRDLPLYVRGEKREILRWDFFGGNLKGITKKIPYLKQLGVSILYLNPIFLADSNHRYDTSDFFEIDPVLGTEADFTELVKTLHANKMFVILDGVFSHVGSNSRYFNKAGIDYGDGVSGAYQSKESLYYDWFMFTKFPDKYESWWGIDNLPEIDKSNPSFREFIYGKKGSVLEKWEKFDIDGWRLDVADELPDDFIRGIRKKLDEQPNKVLIGEVWEDASNKVAYGKRRQYILGDMLHGVMNYPLREAILDFLNKQSTPKEFARALTVLQDNYPREVLYNNLNNLGTHDTERLLYVLEEDEKLLHLALGLLFSFPGVPTIYYGDEAGLTGGKDPDNRGFYPWGQESSSLMAKYRFWTKYYQHNEILVEGDWYVFYNDLLFGTIRYDGYENEILVVNRMNAAVTIDSSSLIVTRTLPDRLKVVIEKLNNVTIEGKSFLLQ